MWQKLKKRDYQVIAVYTFFGLVLAILVFQFVTNSLHNQELAFYSLIERETVIKLIAYIFGASVAGLIFVLFPTSTKENEGEKNNYIAWKKLSEKSKRRQFCKVVLLIYPFGGLLGLIVYKILGMLGMSNYHDFWGVLFSKENIIDYIGMIMAASVFAILFTKGTNYRLRLKYENQY